MTDVYFEIFVIYLCEECRATSNVIVFKFIS